VLLLLKQCVWEGLGYRVWGLGFGGFRVKVLLPLKTARLGGWGKGFRCCCF